MLQNKLVYVVGTKLFYNIRVFENFDSAYECFKKCITTEISRCNHLTDEQKNRLLTILIIIALSLKSKIMSILQVQLFMKLKMFLEKK